MAIHPGDVETDFAGSEVFAGGFVGLPGEAAYEFLEDVAHLEVGDLAGMEVHGGEAKVVDLEEQVLFVEAGDLFSTPKRSRTSRAREAKPRMYARKVWARLTESWLHQAERLANDLAGGVVAARLDFVLDDC